MSLSRRGFLGGLLAVVSAPAIVRVGSLMALPTSAQIILPDGLVAIENTVITTFEGTSRILTLDEFSERILAPMVNRLAQNIADAIMHGSSSSQLNDLLCEARDHQFV